MNTYTIYREIDGRGLGYMQSADDLATVQAQFTAMADGRQVISGQQSILTSYFPGGVVTAKAASPITMMTAMPVKEGAQVLFANLEGSAGDSTKVWWRNKNRYRGVRDSARFNVDTAELYISWDATGLYDIYFYYFPSLPATFTVTVEQ